MSKYVPKELVKKAKEVDLLTYFMNYNPSELVKKGVGTYSLKTHDSVIISNGLWHRFSTNEGGKTALDYLIKVEKMTLQEAVKSILNREIVEYVVPKEKREENKKIVIPIRASTNKQAIEYLKNRGIDEEIIQECVDKKLIYQEDRTKNIVFLGYDNEGNIKYAGCRSTNETIFKQDATGSDKSYSFRLESNTKTDTIYIFEGAIDALSYATFLKLYGMDYKAKTLISLAGIYQPASDISKSKIPLAIQRYLDKHPETKNIFLCFDNDKAGRKASKALQIVLADKYTVVIKPPKKRQRL